MKDIMAGMWRRPEVGFFTTAGSGLAVNLNVVKGALEWATLILGVLIGLLTLIRLLRELHREFRRPHGYRWPNPDH